LLDFLVRLDLPEPLESLDEVDELDPLDELDELEESEEEAPPDEPPDAEDEDGAAAPAPDFWSEPADALSPEDSLLSAFFLDSDG
jgi:hypothetical protein